MDRYTNGWHIRLKELGNLVKTSLVALSSLARPASEACAATVSIALCGESGGYASSSFAFQYDVGCKPSSQ